MKSGTGEIGKHNGLKIRARHCLAPGSSPGYRTNLRKVMGE